uniref:Uncharacterized protein n=1 Tax=Caenorhabditis tropicalis TaxID=1561998 RepID=A0A1I7URV1_9PELO
MICTNDCKRKKEERKIRCESRKLSFQERRGELCEVCSGWYKEPTEEEIEERRIRREEIEAAWIAIHEERKRALPDSVYNGMSSRTKENFKSAFEKARRQMPTDSLEEVREKAIGYMRRRERQEIRKLRGERTSSHLKAPHSDEPRNSIEARHRDRMDRQSNQICYNAGRSPIYQALPSTSSRHRSNAGRSSTSQIFPSTSTKYEIPVITLE